MIGVSLVVCCYNSSSRLYSTLLHISRQELNDSVNFEVIVIDNASKDNTLDCAGKIWKEFNSSIPFRALLESKVGLSNARKRGIQESMYSFVLFCDDDNWLAPDYVQKSYEIMMADSSIGILGGCGIPEYEITPPVWFERYRKSYALGPQADIDGYVPIEQNIYGAGMMVRKVPLEQMYKEGFNSVLTGRKGESLSTGEDIEICIWYSLLGYKLFYSGALTFRHFIPGERLTNDYFLKRSYGKGKTEAIFLLYLARLKNSEVTWLKSKTDWYMELIKRIIHYVLTFKPFKSFDDLVKRRILISSIQFRLANFEYLLDVNERIKSIKITSGIND